MTLRQRVIEVVARKVYLGGGLETIIDGDTLSPEMQDYIDDVYDNGTARQWSKLIGDINAEVRRLER